MKKYVNFSKKNKYKNVRSKCWQDHNHPSKLEALYCNQLHTLKNAGDIYEITYEPKFELIVNGTLIAKHYPDFLIQRDAKKAEYEVHEVKGMESQLWNIKKRLFEALYPDIPYIVIK